MKKFYLFILLFCLQQELFAAIDAQGTAAIYQVMFTHLECNNLHPGDSVGFGGGQRLMVVDMLRKIREYPVYDYHTLMMKFNSNRRGLLLHINQEVDYLVQSLVTYLVGQSLLNHVTLDFKRELKEAIFNFMQTSVVGLPADGYNVTNAQVENFYLAYWEFRNKEQSMSLQERYEACKPYSFPLLYNLRDRYYQGVIPDQKQHERVKSQSKVSSGQKTVFNITGPGGSVGKYFVPTQRAYLIGLDGIRYEFVDVALDHRGSGMSGTGRSYQRFARIDGDLLRHNSSVVREIVDVWGTLIATHVATAIDNEIEAGLLLNETLKQKGGSVKQALELAVLLRA